eukprot:TRINITY_DN24948_c0_g1_i1.p1 TRINITY_DN24948_c0_g1~~TRINITY_DN24948_c0_g1_i1.p1  ORF type:complete len:546 (+),score=101.42 TRINITY_DN24948_c0_g1_i1:27-1640(+)
MSRTTVLEKVWSEVQSGLVSSVLAEAILFPLDTVKLRQQVYGGSVLRVLQRLLRDHGLRGLYQGLLGRLIQTITSNVGFFIWQTLFVQLSLQRLQQQQPLVEKLGTITSLVVNMLAQQLNRVLTTPIDVIANVNQADPKSIGFFHTFALFVRERGAAELWRGLPVALLLSFNPALMFTLVGKLTDFVKVARRSGEEDFHLSSTDMFWISGVSKAVATLLTYPLIRAKAVIQTSGAAASGLWGMLADIARKDGWSGLYQGVWIMSYKTVLFNALMMALKQKVTGVIRWWQLKKAEQMKIQDADAEKLEGFAFRHKVVPCRSCMMPWRAAAKGANVVYVDGSWSFLHAAQVHFLKEAAKRGDHLVLGVHSDETHQVAMGSWPTECYAARLDRLRQQRLVATILEEAPWEVSEQLVQELGIQKVLSGSVTKMQDCAPRPPPARANSRQLANGVSGDDVLPAAAGDPYAVCKRLGIYEEVQSLDASTEHDEWMQKVVKVAFSNVDASIDWRILVSDGDRACFGPNPGYAESAEKPKRKKSV